MVMMLVFTINNYYSGIEESILYEKGIQFGELGANLNYQSNRTYGLLIIVSLRRSVAPSPLFIYARILPISYILGRI